MLLLLYYIIIIILYTKLHCYTICRVKLQPHCCRTGFDSDGLMAAKIAAKHYIEIMAIIPYIGVVFSFKGSLSLDRYRQIVIIRSLSLDHYHFYFLMILKEMPTFTSLSNTVLQYSMLQQQKFLTLNWSCCWCRFCIYSTTHRQI